MWIVIIFIVWYLQRDTEMNQTFDTIVLAAPKVYWVQKWVKGGAANIGSKISLTGIESFFFTNFGIWMGPFFFFVICTNLHQIGAVIFIK